MENRSLPHSSPAFLKTLLNVYKSSVAAFTPRSMRTENLCVFMKLETVALTHPQQYRGIDNKIDTDRQGETGTN